MTIWIIISTSLIQQNFEIRKEQYKRAITILLERNKGKSYKIVIVENNGRRPTFLDEFGIPVLYTNNNFLSTWNKGTKEQLDVLECIKYFGIADDDFVVKITGRYYLDSICPFFDRVDEEKIYDAIIRYDNHYAKPAANIQCGDCVLGLIGMKCWLIKKVKIADTESAELNWAIASLETKNVCIMEHLGIWIAPNSNEFFLV